MKQIVFVSLLIFFSYVSANAQINNNSQWTWVAGDSLLNQTGVYGIQGIASLNNKPGERLLAATWVDSYGNFWLFGGTPSSGGRLNDLWKYDPVSNIWIWVNGSNLPNQTGVYGTIGVSAPANRPGARAGCACWSDINGNLWLFGGRGFGQTSSFGWLNDLWKYDININQWTWISGSNTINVAGNYGIQGITSSTNAPGGRDRPQYWSDNSGNFWVMGGYSIVTNSFIGPSNDLWRYNLGTNQWTWVNGDKSVNSNGKYGQLNLASINNKPGSRVSGSCWSDESGNLWMFGGYGYDANSTSIVDFNDTWNYNLLTGEWIWTSGDSTGNQEIRYGSKGIASSNNNPGSRYGAFTWKDNQQNFWLMAGTDNFHLLTQKNDLWKFEKNNNTWIWIGGDSITNPLGHFGELGIQSITNLPGNKSNGVSWTDSNNNFWLFGGATYRPVTSLLYGTTDLWKLSSASYNSIKICNLADTILKTDIVGTNYQWQLSIDGISFTNLIDNAIYSGTTSNSIHITGIPSSTYGYKLRCVVDGINDKVFMLVFESKWTGLVSNQWENSLNWSCNSLPDQYTDVYIYSGQPNINSNVNIRSLTVKFGATPIIKSTYNLVITH